MIWNGIRAMSGVTTLASTHPEILLVPVGDGKSCWLVGPYERLTPLATALRDDEGLRLLLTQKQVRLGLRASDCPPAEVERQERYGKTLPGQERARDFSAVRGEPLATPVRANLPVPGNRISDQRENVKTFWATQTPQSHHIVEFNHLEELGLSQLRGRAGLDHPRLPAVLLAAEVHQRYLSSSFKPTHGWNKTRLQQEIVPFYRALYLGRSLLYHPLWAISKIVFREARLSVL
jgi:hypothetical protein